MLCARERYGFEGMLWSSARLARPLAAVGRIPTVDDAASQKSGVHKGGFSKGGVSNLCVIIICLLLNPLY